MSSHFENLHGHCDEVGVIDPGVMEEDGHFAGAPEAEVRPFVRIDPVLPRDMFVIAYLVRVVCVEGLVGRCGSGSPA